MAKHSNENGRWWIKADACDVQDGLRESLSGIWAGDEDLGDGSLQELFKEYGERCTLVRGIGSSASDDNVKKISLQLSNDIQFLSDGLKSAKEAYGKVVESSGSSEKSKMELAWNVIGFEELIKKLANLEGRVNGIICGDDVKILPFKLELLNYMKELYTKKRVAATHILVFMIADELRNRKPYAVPVRFMPYKSLSDGKLRQLELELEAAMRENDMTVVGVYNKICMTVYFITCLLLLISFSHHIPIPVWCRFYH